MEKNSCRHPKYETKEKGEKEDGRQMILGANEFGQTEKEKIRKVGKKLLVWKNEEKAEPMKVPPGYGKKWGKNCGLSFFLFIEHKLIKFIPMNCDKKYEGEGSFNWSKFGSRCVRVCGRMRECSWEVENV